MFTPNHFTPREWLEDGVTYTLLGWVTLLPGVMCTPNFFTPREWVEDGMTHTLLGWVTLLPGVMCTPNYFTSREWLEDGVTHTLLGWVTLLPGVMCTPNYFTSREWLEDGVTYTLSIIVGWVTCYQEWCALHKGERFTWPTLSIVCELKCKLMYMWKHTIHQNKCIIIHAC